MFQQPCDWITNTNKLKRAGFNEMKLVCRSLSRVTGCEANSSLMTIEHGYGGHLGPVAMRPRHAESLEVVRTGGHGKTVGYADSEAHCVRCVF